MVSLLLSKFNLQNNGGDDDGGANYNNYGEQWLLLLNKLESILGSLITGGGGGRSEARLWLCNSIAGIKSLSRRQQRDLFVKLLRNNAKDKSLASQLLQMMFERRGRKIGDIIAKRSYLLEKFFDGNRVRIAQWFSNFAGIGGLDHKKGAKALSQFAFVNRDICWEELEWKGKHGQSPAVVATKPHYFLDLDVQRTVENFIENVPEFWSSNEFAESLRDGEILSIDSKYFLDYFVQLMYEEDAVDLWDVINEFLMEESFSLLCKHLLIALEESDLCIFLDLLRRCLSLQKESLDFGNSSCWLEFVLLKYNVCESIDQLLKLNAIINRGRQLLRLLRDEESHEEKTKIKDIVSQIHTISSSANGLLPLLRESFKLKYIEAVKYLGLQSWVILFSLSEESRSLDSWESLFLNNGISFRRSDRYALVDQGFSEENVSEIDDDTSMKRKRRKKKKSRKKRKNIDDDDFYENKLVDLDTSAYQLELQSRVGSWLLSTDGFSVSWTDGDLPEHLSEFCFSTWMKWLPTGVE